eukprot:93957_1
MNYHIKVNHRNSLQTSDRDRNNYVSSPVPSNDSSSSCSSSRSSIILPQATYRNHYFVERDEDCWSMDGGIAPFKPSKDFIISYNKEGEQQNDVKPIKRRRRSVGKPKRKSIKKNRVFCKKLAGFQFYAFNNIKNENK